MSGLAEGKEHQRLVLILNVGHPIGINQNGRVSNQDKMNKPTVFVSSTIEGMQSTRLAVRDLLEQKLGYHVLMSEYEGSKPKRPVAQCKKWAKECDIFISVLGDKYGWIIPRLGISVSEMEFNEAYKDNPEKILVYISAQFKEPKQKEFAKRIEDFSKGYYRRTPFIDNAQLINGIRDDTAEFFKERLDFLRSKGQKIRLSLTPSAVDYAIHNLRDRRDIMMADAISIAQEMGFNPAIFIKPCFWLATKSINRTKVLFTVNVVADNFNHNEQYSYNISHQRHVSDAEVYKQYPNRFALTLVHGSASLRTLDWLTHTFSGTCFKVEPGLFYGEGLSDQKHKPGSLYFENRLILPRIRNRQIMTSAFSDAIEWLVKESNRINFKCNYEKPIKSKPKKFKLEIK